MNKKDYRASPPAKNGTCQRLGGNKVSSFADQTALV